MNYMSNILKSTLVNFNIFMAFFNTQNIEKFTLLSSPYKKNLFENLEIV